MKGLSVPSKLRSHWMNGLGSRVGDAQADEHNELRWQQYPVAQGLPKRILHDMHRIKVTPTIFWSQK